MRLQKWFWLFLAVLLFALGINKQGDLQSLLTLYGRGILHQMDVYEQRRGIQLAFIAVFTTLAAGGAVVVCGLVIRWPWPFHLAAVGLAFQAAFVVIRAASFHHVDDLLGWQFSSVKFNLILESTGLVLILLAASAEIKAATAADRMAAN